MSSRTFSKPKRDPFNPVSAPAREPKFIPAPLTNNVNLNLPLDVVVPGIDAEIEKAGMMTFHAVGDTGGIHGTETQESLAKLMTEQVNDSGVKGGAKPRFFYHLGDVVYFNGVSTDYPAQFYEPYQDYPGPIFAIPGNHDGDIRVRKGDAPDSETSLYGFTQNFCSTGPEFLFKHRETMTQPYVYWTLDTPLATIIGLYSNVDGELDDTGTFEQQRWLTDQLSKAPKDRALIIAVHHPPYSLDNFHGGYPDIGTALDRAFKTSQRVPDLVISGHVHLYERFERDIDGKKVPYVVAGAGGYANTERALHKIADAVKKKKISASGLETELPDVRLMAYNDSQSGFLKLQITKKAIDVEYYVVDMESGDPKGISDHFKVTL